MKLSLYVCCCLVNVQSFTDENGDIARYYGRRVTILSPKIDSRYMAKSSFQI